MWLCFCILCVAENISDGRVLHLAWESMTVFQLEVKEKKNSGKVQIFNGEDCCFSNTTWMASALLEVLKGWWVYKRCVLIIICRIHVGKLHRNLRLLLFRKAKRGCYNGILWSLNPLPLFLVEIRVWSGTKNEEFWRSRGGVQDPRWLCINPTNLKNKNTLFSSLHSSKKNEE